jgi:hypothetical protein
MAVTGQITGVSDGQVILCVSDAFSLLLAEGSEEHHRVPEASWRSGLFFASCTTAPSLLHTLLGTFRPRHELKT